MNVPFRLCGTIKTINSNQLLELSTEFGPRKINISGLNVLNNMMTIFTIDLLLGHELVGV